VVTLVAVNIFVVRDLIVTRATASRLHDDAARTEAQVDANRVQLQRLAAYRTSALALLESATARRDLLTNESTMIRAALGEATSTIVAAYAQIAHHNNHIASLADCLSHIQKAMNTVAVGDLTNGAAALGEVQQLCGATSQ
jgi:hypothetical protein